MRNLCCINFERVLLRQWKVLKTLKRHKKYFKLNLYWQFITRTYNFCRKFEEAAPKFLSGKLYLTTTVNMCTCYIIYINLNCHVKESTYFLTKRLTKRLTIN